LVRQFFSALPAFPAFRVCHVCEGMSHLITPFSAVQAEGIGCAQKVATLLTPDGLSGFVVSAKTPFKPCTVGGIGGWHALRPSCWRYCTVGEVNAPMMAKTR
jgi:hypothetical protein